MNTAYTLLWYFRCIVLLIKYAWIKFCIAIFYIIIFNYNLQKYSYFPCPKKVIIKAYLKGWPSKKVMIKAFLKEWPSKKVLIKAFLKGRPPKKVIIMAYLKGRPPKKVLIKACLKGRPPKIYIGVSWNSSLYICWSWQS